MAILVTGGARSGKSSFAERLAATLGGSGLYVATAQIYDEEMRERVSSHQQQRMNSGFPWETREEPYALAGLLRQLGGAADRGDRMANAVVLVDCLTLWLSNLLLRHEGEPEAIATVTARIGELVDVVSACSYPLILVTNEVGDGIVPATPLGRQFRDLSGRMNARLAELCSQVFLVTAGIPLELKSLAYKLAPSADSMAAHRERE